MMMFGARGWLSVREDIIKDLERAIDYLETIKHYIDQGADNMSAIRNYIDKALTMVKHAYILFKEV